MAYTLYLVDVLLCWVNVLLRWVMGLQETTVMRKEAWVPLRQAVFDIFWRDKLNGGADQILLGYTSSTAPRAVEIDPSAQILKFSFSNGSIYEGVPWDLLRSGVKLPGNPFGAALMHNAVKEIWKTMNCYFDRSVSSSKISIFGRLDDFRAPFTPIPSDQWSLCQVTNWENGTAVLPDGSTIFSVHADVALNSVATAGRKPIYDQDQMNGEVKRALKTKGFPNPEGEIGWQSIADVERLLASFLLNTTGKEPARSSLQKFARKGPQGGRRQTP